MIGKHQPIDAPSLRPHDPRMRRHHRRLLLALCAFSVALGAALAATETVVPVGGREYIDQALARRLPSLADRYPGFESARVWRAADSTLALEVISRRGTMLVRERTPLAAADLELLQSEVAREIAVAPPGATPTMEASGRPLFLAGMTIVGLALYSWGTPVAFDLTDKEAVGVGLVTAIGAGFAAPYFLSHYVPVTYGMANLSLHGATRGAFHGILLVEAIEGGDDASVSGDALAGGAVLGSMIEAAGGFVYAWKTKSSPGTARVIALGSDTGTLYGMGFAELFDGSNENFWDLEKKTAVDVGGLVGTGVGLVAGALAADHWSATWGDGEIVRMGGWVGASWGIASANLDDKDSMLGLAMLGNTIGLVASRRLVSGRDFTPGQAVLVDTGTLAGAALGIGITYLSTEGAERPYWIAAAAGATAGFALTLHGTGQRAARHPSDFGSLQVDLDPAGLVRWAAAKDAPRPRRAVDDVVTPFISARWTF